MRHALWNALRDDVFSRLGVYWFLTFLNADEGDVVVLRLPFGEGAHRAGQPMKSFHGTVAGTPQQLSGESLHTEFIAGVIESLGQSIRVEEKEIPPVEMKWKVGAKPIEDTAAVNPHGHSLGIEPLDLPSFSMKEQGGIVSCAGK